MSTENLKVLQGGTFVFEVAGERFEVYKVLVARNSSALEAMMENGMAASQAGVALLTDTDPTTFGRVTEYFITGNYNAGVPVTPKATDFSGGETSSQDDNKAMQPEDLAMNDDTTLLNSPLPQPPPPAAAESDPSISQRSEDPWDNWIRSAARTKTARKSKTGKSLRSRKTYNWSPVEEDLFGKSPTTASQGVTSDSVTKDVETVPAMPTSSMFIPDGNWRLDYLPVFLSHAKVYVFADQYGISVLKELAARRLEKALDLFQFTSPCSTDFAYLLQYVYDHTATRKKPDALRTVVVNFTARNVKSFIDSEEFLAMIEKGGPLVSDIVIKTVFRLQD